jgi:hypothetical protein
MLRNSAMPLTAAMVNGDVFDAPHAHEYAIGASSGEDEK